MSQSNSLLAKKLPTVATSGPIIIVFSIAPPPPCLSDAMVAPPCRIFEISVLATAMGPFLALTH